MSGRESGGEGQGGRVRVGRPTLVYSLTATADELFPKAYDQLVNALLEEMRSTVGNEQLYEMLQRVAGRLAEPHLDGVDGQPLSERVKAAATALERQGCVTEVSQADGDYFIDEYSCPFPKAAEHDHAVCALHVEFVSIITGAATRLTRSLLRGESACTYRVRPPEIAEEDRVPVAG